MLRKNDIQNEKQAGYNVFKNLTLITVNNEILFSVQFGAAYAAARQRITPENLRRGGRLYFSFFTLHL